MEVGAVKHQLNNEIIHLKKKLNQAKVQIIHKLTRKAGALRSHEKTPEHLKAKLQRKADAAVAEVLLIKKVQPKELIHFALTHKGKLQDHINKTSVDNEKVYAKILLQKTMVEKYKSLREVFANMPINDLLITRKERLKLKKAKKEENDEKNKLKVLVKDESDANIGNSLNCLKNTVTNESDDEVNKSERSEIKSNEESETEASEDNLGDLEDLSEKSLSSSKHSPQNVVSKLDSKKGHDSKTKITENSTQKLLPQKSKKLKDKKVKQKTAKTKKKSENKIESKNPEEIKPIESKVVDSFFLTESGDHYMTLAEPRAPDEVKEEHNRGNRQMRRAEKFGKPMKHHMKKHNYNRDAEIKPRSSKFNKPHLDTRKNESFNSKNFSKQESNVASSKKFQSEVYAEKRKPDLENVKLHPSWEAKKQKSGIVQFQGKKVVF